MKKILSCYKIWVRNPISYLPLQNNIKTCYSTKIAPYLLQSENEGKNNQDHQNSGGKNPKGQKDPKDPKDPKWKQILEVIKINSNIIGRKIFHYKFHSGHLLLIVLMGCLYYRSENQIQLTVSQFTNMVETHAFKSILFVEEDVLGNSKVRMKKMEGTINEQTFYCYVISFEDMLEKICKDGSIRFENIHRKGIDRVLKVLYNSFDIISMLIILAIIRSTSNTAISQRMSSMFNKTKGFKVTKTVHIKFKDVAGMQECKREVQEVVDFLVNPDKYKNLGATIPRGVLLTGPPGTGKTLLAKACAGQANVPFYSVSGSDFVQVFVGVGASRVRGLFSQAKQNSPAIIFIDELDAVGKKRAQNLGSNDERQSTLNQLLVQMDGFTTNNNVIVMAATNRKQILDDALVRAGRFDREIQVDLPDLKGRYQIFLVHLSPLTLSDKYPLTQYAKRLASLTPGFSGAQIQNLCNEAAILAARQKKQAVEMLDFQLSSERVIGGVQRKGFVSQKEKKTVAYHECGHAVVSWFLQGADALLKVTIIPRSKGALGFAQYFLNENQLQQKYELLDRICFILGGRCAQAHFFGEVTTGAYDDLSKAYDLAYQLIAKHGMSEDIGYLSFPDVKYTKPYSQLVQSKIDKQIQNIIKQCTKRTKQMVLLHEQQIKNLAEQLLIHETLDVISIQKILGKRPFPPNKTFEAYFQTAV